MAVLRNYIGLLASLVAAVLLFIQPVEAEPRARLFESIQTPNFRLFVEKNSSEEQAKNLAARSAAMLNETLEELSRVFKFRPEKQVVLRLVSQEEYQRLTGSPDWTSAMYINGVITIPLSKNHTISEKQLQKTIRHEYIHAFIDELSGGNCPAWMDEGLAQLLEGKPNKLLGPALRSWIKHSEALPLAWLRDGFTGLDSAVVPAAYAQSLFAARSLVNTHGFEAVRDYLSLLSKGLLPDEAFHLAFNGQQEHFEERLTPQMKRWAASGNIHP